MLVGQRAQQAGLADAGFAGNERHVAAQLRTGQPLAQRRKQRFPLQEYMHHAGP
jgi:hypothetical protein